MILDLLCFWFLPSSAT